MAVYNWHFSQSGNDTTGNGLINNPWKSLAKAKSQIDAINSNDTANLFFKRGDIWKFDTGQSIAYKVISSNPVVNIDAYGSYGNKPIFDGNISGGDFSSVPRHNDNNDYRFHHAAFQFEKANCSMKNIELRNVYGVGLRVSSNFTCYGNTIHHIGYAAIIKMRADTVTNVLVEQNLIYNIVELSRFNRFVEGAFTWPPGIGMYCDNVGCGDTYDNIYRYNVIYNVYGEGIACGGSLAEYNIVGDTSSVGIYPVPSINDAHNATVRYNFVTMSNSPTYKNMPGSSHKGIEVRDEDLGGYNTNAIIQVYGNIVINRKYGILFNEKWRASSFKGVRIFNNTVIDSESGNFILGHGYDMITPGKGFIYNNVSILYNRTGAIHAVDWVNPTDLATYWTIDNNLFWTKGNPTIVDEDWRNNMIIADPKLSGEHTVNWTGQTGPTYFKDIKFSDLYPLPGSALLGSGKQLGVGFNNLFLTKGTDFSTLPNNPKFVMASQPAYGNWDIGAIVPSNGIDPCDGVVCNPICDGLDLWSQVCDPGTGNCILDQLIESNSASCGYNPCEGVVCGSVCLGNNLWSQVCNPDTGDCELYQLLENNSASCGYDPCVGVVCNPVCLGNDLWSQVCNPDTGDCELYQLLQPDSIHCTIPDKIPSDETTILNYILLGGLGIMGLGMLILSKKK